MNYILATVLLAVQPSVAPPETHRVVSTEEQTAYTGIMLQLDKLGWGCDAALHQAQAAFNRFDFLSNPQWGITGAPEPILAKYRGEWRASYDYMVEACRPKSP